MLFASKSERQKRGLSLLRIKLQAESIPHLNGALSLLGDGYSSTLAPSNRQALGLLDGIGNSTPFIDLEFGEIITLGSEMYNQLKELIVDPQT